ncbi:hypothetical protein TNCV_4588161 [Trichonephila clavipes]|nr:hypothetical protein TNCV_4588161 [Trichonephila clavipes]
MISHTCLIGKRSSDLASQHNTLTPYRACWVATGYGGKRFSDLASQHNTLTPYRACWVATGYDGACYPVGKYYLNDVYKSHCNSLDRQTDVQVCSQGV